MYLIQLSWAIAAFDQSWVIQPRRMGSLTSRRNAGIKSLNVIVINQYKCLDDASVQ